MTVAEPRQQILKAFYSLSQQSIPNTIRHEGHSTTNVPPARVIQQANPHSQTPAWGPQVTERDIQQASPHRQSQSVTDSEYIDPTHLSHSPAEPTHSSSRITHTCDQDVDELQALTKPLSILPVPTQHCHFKAPEPINDASERDNRRANLHSQSQSDTVIDQLDPTDHMDSTSTPCPRVSNPTSTRQAASTTGDLEASKTPANTPTQINERDIPQAIQRSQPSQVTATLKHPTQHSTLPQGQHDAMETRHSSASVQSTSAPANKQNTTTRTPTTKENQKEKKTKNKKKERKAAPPHATTTTTSPSRST
jgi:hypothetical protein